MAFMPPDVHETRPAVITVHAKISPPAEGSAHFLYDPETDDYIGFVRVDKATDLQVAYLDDDQPGWVGRTHIDAVNCSGSVQAKGILTEADGNGTLAEIDRLLRRASSASTDQERLSYSQLAAVKIAYLELRYPARWLTGVPTIPTVADLQAEFDGMVIQRDARDATIAALNAQIASLYADNDALCTELEKREAAIKQITDNRDMYRTRNEAQRRTIVAVRECVE
jgi:hypothetical protein